MFAWANKKLEQLSETLAPQSTPASKFQSALIANDAQTAISYITNPAPGEPPLDPTGVINPAKGTQPIHYAASYSCLEVVQYLIFTCGVNSEAFDYNGNTPLHHAATSNTPTALSVVQDLVNNHKVSVLVKNSSGQTPYDLASLQSVKGFLLPLQLQAETQHCLDNGGVGLIPGMDLGGCRVSGA
eukprot:342529-Ditylum_brightwellii.AAC.1